MDSNYHYPSEVDAGAPPDAGADPERLPDLAATEARTGRYDPPSPRNVLLDVLDVLRLIDARLARLEAGATELAEATKPLLGAVTALRPIRKHL